MPKLPLYPKLPLGWQFLKPVASNTRASQSSKSTERWPRTLTQRAKRLRTFNLETQDWKSQDCNIRKKIFNLGCFFQSGPFLATEKHDLGLKNSVKNENFKPKTRIWSETGFSRVRKPWSAHCELKQWIFRGWKMPNSRFALHGLAPPYFTVCALFLPLIHGLCAFSGRSWHLSRQPPLGQPLSSRFALHGLRGFEVFRAWGNGVCMRSIENEYFRSLGPLGCAYPQRGTGTNTPNSPECALKISWIGAKIWTQTFFSQTFRALPGYPGKIPGYPAQKVWFPWFRGTYRTFWPPPLHMEDPYPTGEYPDSKVWVCALFSFLTEIAPKAPWICPCFLEFHELFLSPGDFSCGNSRGCKQHLGEMSLVLKTHRVLWLSLMLAQGTEDSFSEALPP